jgi:hypothetical protein
MKFLSPIHRKQHISFDLEPQIFTTLSGLPCTMTHIDFADVTICSKCAAGKYLSGLGKTLSV